MQLYHVVPWPSCVFTGYFIDQELHTIRSPTSPLIILHFRASRQSIEARHGIWCKLGGCTRKHVLIFGRFQCSHSLATPRATTSRQLGGCKNHDATIYYSISPTPFSNHVLPVSMQATPRMKELRSVSKVQSFHNLYQLCGLDQFRSMSEKNHVCTWSTILQHHLNKVMITLLVQSISDASRWMCALKSCVSPSQHSTRYTTLPVSGNSILQQFGR